MTIELTPDLERRLGQEAERRGQAPQDLARQLLASALPDVEDLFRGIKRGTPEDLQRLFDEQGVKPVARFEDLLGDFWPEDESVDDFAKARKEW